MAGQDLQGEESGTGEDRGSPDSDRDGISCLELGLGMNVID